MALRFETVVGPSSSGAYFSEDRVYRYTLWRRWNDLFGSSDPKELVAFIGLNPSTADEYKPDPTITRCIGFAKQWGFSGMIMLNLFGYRDTDPKGMKAFGDPVGSLNDAAIATVVSCVGRTVCCWGIHGAHQNRGKVVKSLIRGCVGDVFHFGLTENGHPKHPLYLSKRTELTKWEDNGN